MAQEKCVWVCQKILPDEPGSMVVEWDTYNVGLLEAGEFRAIYSCWSQEDADFLLASLRWFSEFQEEGSMSIPERVRPKRVTNTKAKKGTS